MQQFIREYANTSNEISQEIKQLASKRVRDDAGVQSAVNAAGGEDAVKAMRNYQLHDIGTRGAEDTKNMQAQNLSNMLNNHMQTQGESVQRFQDSIDLIYNSA
jgi:hypothetical protein